MLSMQVQRKKHTEEKDRRKGNMIQEAETGTATN